MNQARALVNYKQIGNNIRKERKRNSLTQAELSALTGMSISYISHIETARKKASLESLLKISDALGITMDELLFGIQCYDTGAFQTDMDAILLHCSTIEKSFALRTISPHILRHTFATRCIEGGMKPKCLQQLLGHSTLAMTMDMYVDITEEVSVDELKHVEKLLRIS